MSKAIIFALLIAISGLISDPSTATTYTWITKETSGPNLHKAICHYTMDQDGVNNYNLYRYKCEQTTPTSWVEERPDPWGSGGPFFTGWFPNIAPFTDVKLIYQELCPQEITHRFESQFHMCDGVGFSCPSYTQLAAGSVQSWKICKD